MPEKAQSPEQSPTILSSEAEVSFLLLLPFFLRSPSALQKLASYLLKDEGRIALSRVQLASALGIGRASLYRALDELTDKGYISSDGKNVTVIDREGLMSLI